MLSDDENDTSVHSCDISDVSEPKKGNVIIDKLIRAV